MLTKASTHSFVSPPMYVFSLACFVRARISSSSSSAHSCSSFSVRMLSCNATSFSERIFFFSMYASRRSTPSAYDNQMIFVFGVFAIPIPCETANELTFFSFHIQVTANAQRNIPAVGVIDKIVERNQNTTLIIVFLCTVISIGVQGVQTR